MDYQHERHNVHLVVYHMIWCPKRRRKILVGAIKDRLEPLIREVASEHGWTILELAIQPDHVHLFLRGDPYTAPSDIARLMKGRSSRVLREEFPELLKLPSLWTQSFFVSTAGNVSHEVIQRYIERQSKV
jgi:putative transposase